MSIEEKRGERKETTTRLPDAVRMLLARSVLALPLVFAPVSSSPGIAAAAERVSVATTADTSPRNRYDEILCRGPIKPLRPRTPEAPYRSVQFILQQEVKKYVENQITQGKLNRQMQEVLKLIIPLGDGGIDLKDLFDVGRGGIDAYRRLQEEGILSFHIIFSGVSPEKVARSISNTKHPHDDSFLSGIDECTVDDRHEFQQAWDVLRDVFGADVQIKKYGAARLKLGSESEGEHSQQMSPVDLLVSSDLLKGKMLFVARIGDEEFGWEIKYDHKAKSLTVQGTPFVIPKPKPIGG